MGLIDDTITATNNGALAWTPLNPGENESSLVFQAIVGPTKLVCLSDRIVASRNSIVALEYDGGQFSSVRAAILTKHTDFKSAVLSQLTSDIAALAGS
jgi:hypothetical protein